MNRERLLNVARALAESKTDPSRFTMYKYSWNCGTPACALGHYASRTDLQDVFSLTDTKGLPHVYGSYIYLKNTDVRIGNEHPAVLEHFGITEDQAEDLFGACGCNEASTQEDAVAYIKDFCRADQEE